MANTLLRVTIFGAASAAALGLFAMTQAAPARMPAPGSFTVAAMNPPAGDDVLAEDAAAAGLTGRSDRGTPPPAPPSPPEPSPPPVQATDPIGDLAASPPPSQVETDPGPYDQPEDQPRAPRAHAALAPHHHRLTRPTTQPHPEAAAPAAAPSLVARTPSRPSVHPHRLHIVIEPPARAVLSPEPGAATVSPDLPQVQADQPAPVDVESQLGRLARAVAADMGSARFALSRDLSAGRQGQAVVTLPAGLLSLLQAEAENSGVAAGDLAITVTLSGQGYAIVPDHALTSRIDTGQPAVFAWRITPSGARGGVLTATMTATLPLAGETRSLPLGLLSAEIPPPVAAPAPVAPTAAPAPPPEPDLSTRLRADLGKVRLPNPSRLRLHDLAIPGRPTLNVPGLGSVPSEKVVAAGLVILLFLLIRALLRGSGDRIQRRRSLQTLDDPYFRQGHS